jgi:3-oxoadipate enol-lactonase
MNKKTMPVLSREHRIEINDVSISYTDEGKSDVPVIFIHGFPFNKSTWQAQTDFLKSTRRVIAYDIRGFGQSTAINGPVNIDLFAGDLLAFMDALHITKTIVCASSMGGYILMNALGNNPERFEAVIFSGTQCAVDSDEAKQARYASIRDIEGHGPENFNDGFLSAALCQETLKTNLFLVNELKSVLSTVTPQTLTATLRALAQRQESCTHLKKILLPALVLYGKEDNLIPVSQSELLFSTLGNARLYAIEKAGHLCHLEQPEAFNQRVYDFIQSL